MTVRMIRVDDGKTGDIHPDEVAHMIAHGWRVDGDAAAADGVIDIPANWQSLHWKQRVALAERLLGGDLVATEGQTQAEAADAVIALETIQRAG